MRSYMQLILFALLLLTPLASFGAETLKLRYVTSALADEAAGQLKFPEGVACNDKSVLIVADTGNSRLVRYNIQDKTLKGGTAIKLPQLLHPVRVQLNSKGDIYVLDGKQRKILHLTPEGAFVAYLDPQGMSGSGNLAITSFKIDAADNLYLVDISQGRVLVLDPAGKLVRQIDFPKVYGFVSDLAVTPGGDILLLDSVNAVVFVAKKDSTLFTPLTGSMREYMNFATYIAAGKAGEFYLVDQDGGAIVVMGLDGSFLGRQLGLGWKNGLLYYPTQICINKNGEFFIADRNNSRVQMFDSAK
jgi:DNA-binding beta-propeller fold protein YncE